MFHFVDLDPNFEKGSGSSRKKIRKETRLTDKISPSCCNSELSSCTGYHYCIFILLNWYLALAVWNGVSDLLKPDLNLEKNSKSWSKYSVMYRHLFGSTTPSCSKNMNCSINPNYTDCCFLVRMNLDPHYVRSLRFRTRNRALCGSRIRLRVQIFGSPSLP